MLNYQRVPTSAPASAIWFAQSQKHWVGLQTPIHPCWTAGPSRCPSLLVWMFLDVVWKYEMKPPSRLSIYNKTVYIEPWILVLPSTIQRWKAVKVVFLAGSRRYLWDLKVIMILICCSPSKPSCEKCKAVKIANVLAVDCRHFINIISISFHCIQSFHQYVYI